MNVAVFCGASLTEKRMLNTMTMIVDGDPKTLYWFYSNTGCRFGLCLSDPERVALAKKITDLIRQYV